ncbi:hypothetical protein RchiOBHm_Chr5g0056251 [Rosa chinensis]|uniref:Uncharacterized protein n=1 Tax=Rosa chinensis TaxID=74649 RepID=A0A2P6QGK9_ROSCH|nr:hypothetical protein RchiOBHm_Chr5g0056251 [Rosa chinensis]
MKTSHFPRKTKKNQIPTSLRPELICHRNLSLLSATSLSLISLSLSLSDLSLSAITKGQKFLRRPNSCYKGIQPKRNEARLHPPRCLIYN